MPTEPTGRKYQNFDQIADNNTDAPPVGAPEQMPADTFNNTQRYDKAAMAELAHDLGLDPADFASADQPIGWQPQNDVEFTGGNVSGLLSAAMDPGYAPSDVDDLTDKAYVDAAIQAGIDAHLPIGAIIQWYGLAANVPSGWSICDGQNGTPDMSHAFARGAQADGEIGTGGGNDTATTSSDGSHAHAGSSVASHVLTENEIPGHVHGSGGLVLGQDGGHRHATVVPLSSVTDENIIGGMTQAMARTRNNGGEQDYTLRAPDDPDSTAEPSVGKTDLQGGHGHVVSGDVASAGGGLGHDHGLTVGADGAHSHTVNNMPAFNFVYFIMRTG